MNTVLLSIFVFVLLSLLGAWRLLRRASNERNWKPDVARVARADIEGDMVHIKNVRNNRYGEPDTPYEVIWEDRSYDLSKLKRLWLLVEPFHTTIDAIAHTFLSFEFDDDFLALSVEARTQIGENYAIVKGLFGEFEIIYSFGDERDFIMRRSNYMQRNVYMYPLITPPHEIKALFLSMAGVANKLADKPRFYHSIVENCTSSLKVHANKARPGSFPPFIWAQVLPGRSDKVLYDKGWLDTGVPFEALRETYNVGSKARQYADDPEFSRKIREV